MLRCLFFIRSSARIAAACAIVSAILLLAVPSTGAQNRRLPLPILARILQLEDERDLGSGELIRLLADRRPEVRQRAALALGRIGDKRAIAALQESLRQDAKDSVRLMSAFALGEIEDPSSVDVLLAALDRPDESIAVRARAIEALGKLASLPASDTALTEKISRRLIGEMSAPGATLTADQRQVVGLSMTALMRLRSPSAVGPLSHQLSSFDPHLRAQAANALFRIRRPLASALPQLIVAARDRDADVRANAARTLGMITDRSAFDALLKLLVDRDDRVRVSSVRGLASFGDAGAAEHLIRTGEPLLKRVRNNQSREINLLLEISAALGALKDVSAVPFLLRLRGATGVGANPEVEIALARLDPSAFLEPLMETGVLHWRQVSNLSQGLGEISSERAAPLLVKFLSESDRGSFESTAVPAILRAMRKVKLAGLTEVLQKHLSARDVIVRATAAQLLSEARDDLTLKSLISALELSMADVPHDAQLALVEAISAFKSERAVEAIRSTLRDGDYLVRKQAIEALVKLGVDRADMKAEPVGTLRNRAFYEAVARRAGRPLMAVIETDKGRIAIELLTAEAPLTVENFVGLARRNYFNGLTFHRVVANFVIQGGDPRGDGGGGPGHQIRCEVNLRPYLRGTIGMALSGKDTGGSQFFATHSPQPHLDGGYTVFGQVVGGLEVLDRVTRGDVIRRVTIRAKPKGL